MKDLIHALIPQAWSRKLILYGTALAIILSQVFAVWVGTLFETAAAFEASAALEITWRYHAVVFLTALVLPVLTWLVVYWALRFLKRAFGSRLT